MKTSDAEQRASEAAEVDAPNCSPVSATTGTIMLARRADVLRELDWIRTGLMFAPRGHAMMSGSILYPPTRANCDVPALSIESSGGLPMCGQGTIRTVTMGIENSSIMPLRSGTLAIDTPAGRADIT